MAGKHRQKNGALKDKERVTVRIDADLLKTIKEQADKEKRSLSSWVELLLERQVDSHSQANADKDAKQ